MGQMLAEQQESSVVLNGISWEAYLQLDEILGEDRKTRLWFCDEQLEIISPTSRRHEHIKSNIGRMVEIYCRKKGLFFQTEGGATLLRPGKRGGEPDESYIFHKGRQEPDLVIEAALTTGGIDKLTFYRGIGIPEVWIWQDGCLGVYLFETASGHYRQAEASSLLPHLDLNLVERLADGQYTSEVLDEFEAALG